jgi:mycofactocin precursor
MPEVTVDDQVVTAPSENETGTDAPSEIGDLLVEDVSIDGMCGVY